MENINKPTIKGIKEAIRLLKLEPQTPGIKIIIQKLQQLI
jgi:hypothetical protein|tara:strand:+ start:986 stop:1105 length:120 start_codon:yes stop_codon:yes gene_type:complete